MEVVDFLKGNVKPAADCTEVVAVGLTASIAYNSIYGVTIPNSGGKRG